MQVPEFSRLERDPLHERAYRQLRDAVMSAQFEPGQKLSVRMMASAFGTSTMPIRAAFARLVAEKALVTDANGTVAIPALTREQFSELVSLRLLLEGSATERAASRITSRQLKVLGKLANDITAASETNNAPAYIKANKSFKFAIFEAAESPAMFDLIERVWLQIAPFMSYYSKDDVRVQKETDEQDCIVRSLSARDAAEAKAAVERDISGGAHFLLEKASFANE